MRIPFYDCDPMGVSWHGHYIKYFEKARYDLLEKLDYNYEAMRDNGHAWPIVKINAKYIHPLIFGQKIIVKSAIIEIENRLRITYTIYDETKQTIHCKGETIQMAVDVETKNTLFMSPQILLDKMNDAKKS